MMDGVIGAVMLAIGICSIVYVFRIRSEARQSEKWHQTSGRIRSAKLRQVSQRWPIRYSPDIEYEYTVNGQPFHGRNSSLQECHIQSR